MCGKQCRDENGFKCHLSSDAHRRQMEVFGQAPERIIEGYSEEFQKDFLEHLTRCHPRARVLANKVYNEFIADRDHIHMNSTKWLTLTDFVADLGRQGIVRVDEDPLGLHIRLVRQDDGEREREADRRAKRERHEESRKLRDLEERAKLWAQQETAGEDEGNLEGPLGPGAPREAAGAETRSPADLAQALSASSALSRRRAVARSGGDVFADGGEALRDRSGVADASGAGAARRDGEPSATLRDDHAKPRSKIEELMEGELRRKERNDRRAREGRVEARGRTGERSRERSRERSGERSRERPRERSWDERDGRGGDRSSSGRREDRGTSPPRPSVPPFFTGVIVKIKSPALRKEGYYNQKGEIVALSEGGRTADIEVLSSGDLVRVDRAELETVIPNPGGSVLVLEGSRRGERGVVTKIDVDRYRAFVDLGGGEERAFPYEKISKAAKRKE